MHQIRFLLGSAPDPAGGGYSAPPNLLAVFKGPTSKGTEGEGARGREGEGKRRGGREVERRGGLAPNWRVRIRIRHCYVAITILQDSINDLIGSRKDLKGIEKKQK